MTSHARSLPEPRNNRALDVDALNANGGVILTMTAQFTRVITTPALEHLDLGSAPVIHRCRHNGGPGKIGSADFAFSAADHQHLVQRNFTSGLHRKLFHNYFGTFFNAVLFSAGFYNRVHDINLQKEKGIFAPLHGKCQAPSAIFLQGRAATVKRRGMQPHGACTSSRRRAQAKITVRATNHTVLVRIGNF